MTISLLASALSVLAALGGTPVTGGAPAPKRAALAEPPYRVERVEVEGDPAHVVLTLRREMRTAGWDLRVESVESVLPERRIRVRMLAVPPDGIVAQVISPREVRVDLGPTPPGRFTLEIWERIDGAHDSEPAQAEVLIVVGSPTAPDGR